MQCNIITLRIRNVYRISVQRIIALLLFLVLLLAQQSWYRTYTTLSYNSYLYCAYVYIYPVHHDIPQDMNTIKCVCMYARCVFAAERFPRTRLRCRIEVQGRL
jgi:hypothetical protein